MRYCKYCHGDCRNKPTISPQKVGNSIHDLQVDLENIYKYKNWGININPLLPHTAFKFHFHYGGIYGVFNHYYGIGKNPDLICSYCEDQIPVEIYEHLIAMNRLWTKE